MQAGKNAMELVKEKAANIGASAVAGMEKTKATIEEKVEKATVQHPTEKQMAEHKKEERIHEADVVKRKAMEHNAAVREHARSAEYHPSQGAAGIKEGRPVGGGVEEGVAQARPVGLETGTARASAAHNPMLGTDYREGHGTGHHST